MEVDPRSSFSEIVWRLSRLRDRGRITPGQHPFFYHLPISVNDECKLYPIEDFQAVFNHNVYVLVDKPGWVSTEPEPRNLTFLDVWIPKYTLLFKGTLSLLPLLPLALTSNQTSSALWWGNGLLSPLKLHRTYASGIPSTLQEPMCFLLPWLASPRRLPMTN